MKIKEMHFEFDLELDRVASADRPYFTPWEKDSYIYKAIWLFLKQRYNVDPRTKRGFESDQHRISQLSSLVVKSPQLQPAIVPTELESGKYEIRLNALGNNINNQYFRYLYLTDVYVKARSGRCTKYIWVYQNQSDDVWTVYSDPSWKWRRCLAEFGRSTFVHPHPDANPLIDDENDHNAELERNNRYNTDELSSLYLYSIDRYGTKQFSIEEVYISYIKYPNRPFIGGYDTLDGMYTASSKPVHCDLDDAFHDEIVRLAVKLARQDIQDPAGIQISERKTLEDRV